MDGRPDLRERARRGRAPPTNLPTLRNQLIGRERELRIARERLLRDDVGLLTLTGPGGSGKTRLALQLATDLLDQFDDGAWLVSLAPVRAPELIASTISQALGLQDQSGRPPADTLRDFFRQKRVLLLVDNFEHLLEGASLIAELLAVASGLTVLATSRSPLNLHHEHELLVPPLALPDRRASLVPQELLKYGAIELFVQRVAAIQPTFRLTPDNAMAVVESCRRLDGLPLALELVAARLRLLSPQAMLTRLERRLPLLTGGARDLPARQQALRATIAWSYDLLNPDEQRLFRHLAVFDGGCTLDAIERVGSGQSAVGGTEFEVSSLEFEEDRSSPLAPRPSPLVSSLPTAHCPLPTLDVVDSLVEKSLLQRQVAAGEPRFVMLETIREYAMEQLDLAGELATTRRRHAEYFLALAEQAEPALLTSEQVGWFERLEAEHDNLRAVLLWARTEAEHSQTGGAPHRSGLDPDPAMVGLRLAGALRLFWHYRGYWYEGRQWLETVLDWVWLADSDARVKALLGAGYLAQSGSNFESARRRLQAARSLAQRLGSTQGIAWACVLLGLNGLWTADYASAQDTLDEALAASREIEWR
jgi:predicted ATPase